MLMWDIYIYSLRGEPRIISTSIWTDFLLDTLDRIDIDYDTGTWILYLDKVWCGDGVERGIL